jgi:lysophospholipase L1-like esterase
VNCSRGHEDKLMNDLHWTGSWSQGITDLAFLQENIANQTVRMVIKLSLGGEQLRIRLSNKYGLAALAIGAGHVAFAGDEGTLIPGSGQPLHFNGQRVVQIPVGGEFASDPVNLATASSAALAVSLYFPQPTALVTGNCPGIAVYSCQGNAASGKEQPFAPVAGHQMLPGSILPISPIAPFLAGVDIASTRGAGAIVAFGNSITWLGWPAMLAERLRATGKISLGMLNQGIAGNRILHDSPEAVGGGFGPAGIKRFAHDALDQPGVQYVLVLQGQNDLGQPGLAAPLYEEVSAEEMIGGLRAYVGEAHAREVIILGGTIPPFEAHISWTPEHEAKRQTVNEWIRNAGVFDGVFDADLATREPDRPSRLRAAYDSGDHLHPNRDGLRAIAASVDTTAMEYAATV